MEALPSLILAIAGLAVALYAHSRIPRFTASEAGVLVTRAGLLTAGVGFAWVMSATAQSASVLDFLAWFGLVHVPAAIILFIKGARGSGRT